MIFDFVGVFRNFVALMIFARELVPAKAFRRARARVVQVEYQYPAFVSASVKEKVSIDRSIRCPFSVRFVSSVRLHRVISYL